jgi:hypothetical protein
MTENSIGCAAAEGVAQVRYGGAPDVLAVSAMGTG